MNGGRTFSKCLDAIMGQNFQGSVQLVVIDSGSTDQTLELARKAGARVKEIDQKRFHHAKSRNEAVTLAAHHNIVFTVQDAIPCTDSWLTDLMITLDQTGAVAAYTAQEPHDHATPWSRFEIESINEARGRDLVIQRIESLESYEKMPYHAAYRTIGLDNVCAIYRKERLLKTPFPAVGFAEDLAWSQENLLRGHKIVYNPGISVKHSHNRSPGYAFRRQIINSYWCARIMQRVEKDLSYVTPSDLRTVTENVAHFASGLRSKILEDAPKGGAGGFLLQEILKQHFPAKGLKRFFGNGMFGNRRNTSKGLDETIGETQTKIKVLFRTVKEKHHVCGRAERISLLEQVTANVVGRVYGEVYASHVLTGNLASSLESLMRPFFYGV